MKLDPSLFVSPAVHERKIKLADDSEEMFFFREITNEEYRRFQIAERSSDIDVRVTAPAILIAASLCDEEGEQVLSIEQAAKLKPKVASNFTGAILDVNGFTEKKASPSAENTGSATS